MGEPADSVSVILGGGSGVGAALARRLAREGGTLILNYLENRERAVGLAAGLEGQGARVRLVEGNVADPGVRERLATVVSEAGGRCDRLAHCVAVTSFKPLLAVRPNQWNLVFEVSARSLLDVAVVLLAPLALARGSVVAISSQGSTRHVPGYGALGPAKAALEGVVRQLAVELAPRGIRVNAVRAGLLQSEVVAHLPEEVPREVERRTPLGRLGTADEIAAVAMFLLSPEAAWVVGQVVEVDGGFAIR